MSLVDRHIAFVEALRSAGLPVSLSEGLDAVHAISGLGLGDRETLRAAYAATLVKRQPHRAGFDQVFDLYFPALIGDGATQVAPPELADARSSALDGPEQLAEFREALVEALGMGDPDALALLAREAVQRFGMIRGRGPGEQRWSSYNVMNRVSPAELVGRVMQGLGVDPGDDPATRRLVEAQARAFEGLVEAEVRRRAAEVRGPEHVARYTVRKSIDQLDFTAARRSDLEEMRRELGPLARRLASRMNRHQAARRRGPVDFRHTVRASMSTGGVPLEVRHRPRRPHRSDLVVLCDISGSVANFASFTLMLVFALREQFDRVRAFTFVDEIHEVTDRFRPGLDAVGPHQLRPGIHPLRRAAPRRTHPEDAPAGARRRPLQLLRPRAPGRRRPGEELPARLVAEPGGPPALGCRRLRGPRVRSAAADGGVPQPRPARAVRARLGLTGDRRSGSRDVRWSPCAVPWSSCSAGRSCSPGAARSRRPRTPPPSRQRPSSRPVTWPARRAGTRRGSSAGRGRPPDSRAALPRSR
jgi:uncharacterized protein with von Willebrand factor type A (vWA) domain